MRGSVESAKRRTGKTEMKENDESGMRGTRRIGTTGKGETGMNESAASGRTEKTGSVMKEKKGMTETGEKRGIGVPRETGERTKMTGTEKTTRGKMLE